MDKQVLNSVFFFDNMIQGSFSIYTSEEVKTFFVKKQGHHSRSIYYTKVKITSDEP